MKKSHFVIWNVIEHHLILDGTDANDIRQQLTEKYGQLPANTMIRPYAYTEEVRRRYPNLISACKFSATLCDAEAIHAVAMHKMGYSFASEAVNHAGGPTAMIADAVKIRQHWHNDRQSRIRYYTDFFPAAKAA